MNQKIGGFGRLFKQIDECMARRLNNSLQRLDLTASQMHFLMALNCHGGTLALKEMEELFNMAQSTVAGLAARLEKKELVVTVPDPTDRRVKRIQITEKGRAAFRAATDDMLETEHLITSPLSEEEREALYSMLERVYENIK